MSAKFSCLVWASSSSLLTSICAVLDKRLSVAYFCPWFQSLPLSCFDLPTLCNEGKDLFVWQGQNFSNLGWFLVLLRVHFNTDLNLTLITNIKLLLWLGLWNGETIWYVTFEMLMFESLNSLERKALTCLAILQTCWQYRYGYHFIRSVVSRSAT